MKKNQQHHFEDISSNNKENIFNGKSINRIGSSNDQFDSRIYNISNTQKSLKGEQYGVDPGVIDNFTSPEPYPFYLHPSNSDLSNPSSSETYNRAGSKNYFVSETPTPFLYNDIVNKGRRTDTTKKNKWDNKIRKQKGIKLGFPSTKKWYLKICKENDILYEQEADDVIINDDYNNVKGPEMRPITATIIKVNEEEETSSVSSYDVFENLIIKKANYEGD